MKKKRAAPRRVSVHRDRAYLNWLRDRECVICILLGRPAVSTLLSTIVGWMVRIIDPAHGTPNGIASKGADDGCCPLCRWHHNEQTARGWEFVEAKYGFSREKEAAAHFASYQLSREYDALQAGVDRDL